MRTIERTWQFKRDYKREAIRLSMLPTVLIGVLMAAAFRLALA